VLEAGLGALPRGPAAVEERLAGEMGQVRLVLERRLAALGTVGSNAPFVGLLGTVIGIIRAFHALDQSGGQVYQRRIGARIAQAEALGRELLSYVKDEQRTLLISEAA